MQKNTRSLIKFISVLLFMAIIISSLPACKKYNDGYVYDSSKINIVATMFPQYDIAKNITGDRGNVKLLLPPGSESHNYEPTPSDIEDIYSCDIFIYTGAELEPWAETLIEGGKNQRVKIIDCSSGINISEEAIDESHEDGDGHVDQHIWLDPCKLEKMTENILNAIHDYAPGDENDFIKNTNAYKEKIKEFDNKMKDIIDKSDKTTLVFAGPFAYYHFFEHYGINYITAYDSCSTEVEPGIKRINEIIDFLKTNNIKYIFTDNMSQTKTAQMIKDETEDAEILFFSSMHNRTKEETENNSTYFDILEKNIENIEKALENK